MRPAVLGGHCLDDAGFGEGHGGVSFQGFPLALWGWIVKGIYWKHTYGYIVIIPYIALNFGLNSTCDDISPQNLLRRTLDRRHSQIVHV